MADIDLKTETPDASIDDSAILFGADSQASANPSVYSVATVRSHFVGAGTLNVASGKTLTASNTLTLAGTDGTTMTFPTTSATLARTDAGNTFTGNQTLGSSDNLNWNSDTILTRRGAANLRLGAADAAAPVAQTLSVQSVVAGTSNTAGANLIITGSQGTGTGAGGAITFQIAPAGGAGSVVNGFSTYNALSLIPTTGGATNCFISRALITSYGRSTATGVQGMCSIGAGTDSGFLTVGAPGNIPTVSVSTGGCFAFSSNANNNWNDADVRLFRDDANKLALRNGTNAQTFNVYNTFTSSTNFERFRIFAQSGAAVLIGTEKGSAGGTARALELQTDGTTRLTIAATTGNITTTGSVTTEAPTGGTAAAWRLGIAATVSPTSPNRTIEVDIGGTIYYIAAKTTND